MDGFSHLYYRCITCQYYTKLGIRVASNAYGAPYAKALISAKVEMRVFCLLRLCPNPRRTQFCVLETLEKSSSYAILQIAKWASTPVLFRFSRHGERIVSKNPIYIAVEDDFEGPSPEEMEELSEIEKKWAEKYPPKKSQE